MAKNNNDEETITLTSSEFKQMISSFQTINERVSNIENQTKDISTALKGTSRLAEISTSVMETATFLGGLGKAMGKAAVEPVINVGHKIKEATEAEITLSAARKILKASKEADMKAVNDRYAEMGL